MAILTVSVPVSGYKLDFRFHKSQDGSSCLFLVKSTYHETTRPLVHVTENVPGVGGRGKVHPFG